MIWSSFADEVKFFNPVPLFSGGFIYEVELKAPLQIPVRLMLSYVEVDSDQRMNFTSEESYFNFISIKHVAEEDRVPFDSFRVEIALVHQRNSKPDLVGPFFKPNNVYGEECYCN